MGTKTIYETDDFHLYTDKNGKYWLWDKKDESNLAIRNKTEIGAYRTAIDMAIFKINMIKESRDILRKKMSKLETVYLEIFHEEDQDE